VQGGERAADPDRHEAVDAGGERVRGGVPRVGACLAAGLEE
jgi:hypothetical protein